MAKNFIKPRKHDSGRTITTPTPYGTTKDMVVTDESILKEVQLSNSCVLVKDDTGYYITEKTKVDNGLADPHRFDLQYRHNLEDTILKHLDHGE